MGELERIKELNRLRQERYYAKNKAKVCEKKKKDRAELKRLRGDEPDIAVTPVETVNQSPRPTLQTSRVASVNVSKPTLQTSRVASMHILGNTHTPHEQQEQQEQQEQHEQPHRGELVYNEETVLRILNELDISPATKSTYQVGTKALFHVSKCNNLKLCFKHPKKMIKQIEDGEKMRGGGKYSINSKKGIYQTIVYLIDKFNIPISVADKKKFQNAFDSYKIKSTEQTEERASSEEYAVMPIKKYMEKVKEKFGTDSKEFLVVSLYNDLTVRDDYSPMTIVTSKQEINNTTENYLIVPKTRLNCVLFIQSYKTDKKYGTIEHKTSAGLNKLLREYIQTKELSDGDYLFNSKNGLSDFVSKMNKTLGITNGGGINYIRESKISQELNSKAYSTEKRVELARSMKHSPVAQLKYVRLVKA